MKQRKQKKGMAAIRRVGYRFGSAAGVGRMEGTREIT